MLERLNKYSSSTYQENKKQSANDKSNFHQFGWLKSEVTDAEPGGIVGSRRVEAERCEREQHQQ